MKEKRSDVKAVRAALFGSSSGGEDGDCISSGEAMFIHFKHKGLKVCDDYEKFVHSPRCSACCNLCLVLGAKLDLVADILRSIGRLR